MHERPFPYRLFFFLLLLLFALLALRTEFERLRCACTVLEAMPPGTYVERSVGQNPSRAWRAHSSSPFCTTYGPTPWEAARALLDGIAAKRSASEEDSHD